jgi:hypothetical protein
MPQTTFAPTPTMDGLEPSVDATGLLSPLYAKKRVKNVTAAATTVTGADSGTMFTNEGTATNMTFTLPAVATSAGFEYWFAHDGSTYTLTVTAPAGTLVGFNSITSTSIALSTASKMIGNIIHVYCDGTKWISSGEISKVVAGGTIFTLS